jgi:4-carboxymuconolactone decarboxylase
MNSQRETGRKIVAEMLGDEFAANMTRLAASDNLGSGMARQALDNCYGHYWADERLDRRSRSLVTLGIVIALRAGSEIKNHVRGALNNGVTVQEIEALIEHAIPYVGYPAAGTAFATAMEVLAGKAVDLTTGGNVS